MTGTAQGERVKRYGTILTGTDGFGNGGSTYVGEKQDGEYVRYSDYAAGKDALEDYKGRLWCALGQPENVEFIQAVKDLKAQVAGLRRALEGDGFYVASRASVPERGAMWRQLRDSGVHIMSSWIDEDGEGQTADFVELWMRIEREVKQAKALILYAEPTDFPLKGAYIEVGMALAAGKPIFVVLPGVELEARSMRPVGSWLNHPSVRVVATVNDAVAALASQPAPQKEGV